MSEVRPKVFLSYARADDEAFVERLHRDLIRRRVEVWWDRATMANRGRTFLQEIRDAIESVDRVVAVVGPRALLSEYVRSEWDHAVLFAKGIVPILRLGTYDLLPTGTAAGEQPRRLLRSISPNCTAQISDRNARTEMH